MTSVRSRSDDYEASVMASRRGRNDNYKPGMTSRRGRYDE